MKKIVTQIIAFVPIVGIICFFAVVYAEPTNKYNVKKITHVYTDNNGRVGIKWKNSPRPGPCAASGQTNHGWVMIPASASDAQKALAISIYLKGKKARIDCSGCDGNYEIVRSLYSPGG